MQLLTINSSCMKVQCQKKKVNEGSVNEIFGWSDKEKFAKLDPNDKVTVDELFQNAFKNILMNPMMSIIGDAARKATTEEKYALLQQYFQGGGGSLRRDQNTGKLAYITKQQQDKGIAPPKGGGSTGIPGI